MSTSLGESPLHFADPDGRFAVRATKRSVELWIIQAIAFAPRPAWQDNANGPVALLHRGLVALQPKDGDVLSCVWACTVEGQRLDVENRLFTNVLSKAKGAQPGPNPFAGLPGRVCFERSFRPAPELGGFDTAHCLYYRYELADQPLTWENWCVSQDSEPLASWQDVPVAGMSTGNGRATWASMRRPGAEVNVHRATEPHHGDFALQLSIRSPRPLRLVSNMEMIIDGVVASFQREPDRARARAVAGLIGQQLSAQQLTHDLVTAQCDGPRLFAAPPFQLNAGQTWCQLNPADDKLVAGLVELTVVPGVGPATFSGTLQRVERS